MYEHIPVMIGEVLEGLAIRGDGIYWDGTFGQGGHAAQILKSLSAKGKLYASDHDAAAEASAERFSEDHRVHFLKGSLSEAVVWVPQLSGFLWDLGCSTPQLKDPERGFSFQNYGPLDMRMDRTQPRTAADIVNETREKELADLIYKYGEERFSRRIAARIVARRKEAPILDTAALAGICRSVYPRRYHRIDPATRTFQALRIIVNDELGQLESTLPQALNKLEPGGRAVLISFHSLEDRIVKHCFRDHARTGDYRILTKKPLVAGEDEARENPASRSAKLRVLERV